MKLISYTIIFLIAIIFLNAGYIYAQEGSIYCNNRYVTLVNPVRSRYLWIDKSTKPLIDQYNLVKKYEFSATWLLQYDVLNDDELISKIRKFDKNQELGLFLEVSENFAENSRVIYPYATPWFSPNAVFLSGYSQTDRRKLIDRLFQEFKKKFEDFPKSVGAWWIDSYSLNYMRERYGIKSALIVADQKTTDNYGVWGQWWGMPYFPTYANILTPASNLANKQNIVILQWAQRDPILAYGEGPIYSNYSLQANDYIRQGKGTNYFKQLTDVYLDCKNPVGQITVGLETGIESVGFIDEYENQLKYLSTLPYLNIVSMSEFSDKFSEIFPDFPKKFEVSPWILKSEFRSNDETGDYIKYNQDVAFKDFFVADKQNFLDRDLENLKKDTPFYFPYFILVILLTGLISLVKKIPDIWIIGTLFAFSSFGLILRSNFHLGWQVYYGSIVPYLTYVQIILVLISYLTILFLSKINFVKKNKLILWLIPLSFGLDYITQAIRLSYFSGKYYLGFAIDSLRFLGFTFSETLGINFVNQDFSSVISTSLLKVDFDKIWDSLFLSILVYPFVHIVLAIIFGYFLIKLPNRIRKIIISIFCILSFLYLFNISQADARLVQ